MYLAFPNMSFAYWYSTTSPVGCVDTYLCRAAEFRLA